MALEIERKYLIDKTLWDKVTPERSVPITQVYLSTEPNKTIRVRTLGDRGYITIKGKTTGITRSEYEYEIPLLDAEELIDLYGTKYIKKIRHYVQSGNHLWEVDEFLEFNAGLFVAEIELTKEDEDYEMPTWVKKEVSHDKRYSNSNLAEQPYTSWKS